MILFLKIMLLLVSIGLIFIVTIQSSKGEGLGAIGGSAQVFFSKNKEADRLLNISTTVLAVLFMVLAIVVTVLQK